MTIPRIELGISRVSGERVSHCTIQSWILFPEYHTSKLYPLRENKKGKRDEGVWFGDTQGFFVR